MELRFSPVMAWAALLVTAAIALFFALLIGRIFTAALAAGLSWSAVAVLLPLVALFVLCLPMLWIAGDILLQARRGVTGLRLAQGHLETLEARPRRVMDLAAVACDIAWRVVVFEAPGAAPGLRIPGPLRVVRPSAGRLRIPLFLLSNDREFRAFIEAQQGEPGKKGA